MNWKARREGSSKFHEGVSKEQLVKELMDGKWEPTDEVIGPKDQDWSSFENHPQFAELIEEMEHQVPAKVDEETHLDMNPLIDVSLVLLIFFILTTSYAALQRVLEMPATTTRDQKGPIKVSATKVAQTTIRIEARKVDGKTVIKVEDQTVEPDKLLDAIAKWVGNTSKTDVLIDAKDVDWGTVVLIQDAAKGAGVQRAHFLVPKKTPTS